MTNPTMDTLRSEEDMKSLQDKATEAKKQVGAQIDSGLAKLPPEVTERIEKAKVFARERPLEAELMALGALSVLRRLLRGKKK